MTDLTTEQNRALEVLNGVLSIIGFVFATCLLLVIIILGKYRKTADKLVLPIVVAFLFETSSIAVSTLSHFGSAGCVVFAFIFQFAGLIGFYFVALFAVHLYRKIVRKKQHTGRSLPLMNWFAWTFAAFNSFLPLTTNGYGTGPGYLCWISQQTWMFITYFGPLLIVVVVVAILYALIVRALLRRSRSGIFRTLQHSFILISYPISFLFLRSAGIVNHFNVLVTGEKSYALYFWNYLFNGFLPIFFCAIYFTQLVSEKYWCPPPPVELIE